MKISHLEAVAKVRGFKSLEAYLNSMYILQEKPMIEVAEDLEISVNTLRMVLDSFAIQKPKKRIPITLKDARSMGPDALAVKYHTSRATAWRWKKTILFRGTDHEAYEEADAPDVGAESKTPAALGHEDGD